MSHDEHFVLVDDEEDLLRSLVAALRRARPLADVAGFADPVLADQHLQTAPRVDALITDIRMPKLDGIELLVRARQRLPRLPTGAGGSVSVSPSKRCSSRLKRATPFSGPVPPAA